MFRILQSIMGINIKKGSVGGIFVSAERKQITERKTGVFNMV